jgi:Protein of unknown function (DUF3638)
MHHRRLISAHIFQPSLRPYRTKQTPEPLAESVFYFRDQSALQVQDNGICQELLDDVFRVLQGSFETHPTLHHEPCWLSSSRRLEDLRQCCANVIWKAHYASVIVFRRLDSQRSFVYIVGLDGWRAMVHNSTMTMTTTTTAGENGGSGGRQSTAVPNVTMPVVFGRGPFATALIAPLVVRIDAALDESEQHNTGVFRRATAPTPFGRHGHGRGRQQHQQHQQPQQQQQQHLGNQKTPSFLRAIVWNAMQETIANASSAPAASTTATTTIQGGTTDVGLHTGCIRRNTSFPLVASLLCWTLRLQQQEQQQGEPDEDNQTFYQCLITYYIHHLQTIGDRVVVAAAAYDPTLINRVMVIIRAITEYTTRIKEDHTDDGFKKAVVSVVEYYYNKMLETRPTGQANFLSFPPVSEILWGKELRAPTFPALPDNINDDDDNDNDDDDDSDSDDGEEAPQQQQQQNEAVTKKLDQARVEAAHNLHADTISFDYDNHGHSLYVFNGHVENSYVQIDELCGDFWDAAEELSNDTSAVGYNVAALREQLVLLSKHVALADAESVQTPQIMTPIFRSVETVAIWVVYCCALREAERAHPSMTWFLGSDLDPNDLVEVVVLPDIWSRRAVELVRQFLEPRFAKSCKLFRTVTDTLFFASYFGKRSKDLCAVYEKEIAAANQLIQERWKAIQETQLELKSLDRHKKDAVAELQSAEQAYQHSREYDYEYCTKTGSKLYSDSYDKLRTAWRAAATYMERLVAHIGQLEKKQPPNLYLGLPRDMNTALQWLFFLLMPTELRHLAALAQLGQSKLWRDHTTCVSNDQTESLCQWYTTFGKTDSVKLAKDTEIRLVSNLANRSIKTPGIRNYSIETGVFFPDSFSVNPIWKGFDPFAADLRRDEATKLFTESLPLNTHQKVLMESFLALLPTCTRESEAIACTEGRPEWLNQEQFVAYANLRAHPRTQIRCLVAALHDDLLPFHDVRVHILIKQLLYHVGCTEWTTDLTGNWRGYERLALEMERQLDKIRDSPKDCDALLIFGSICSYLGQSDKSCLDLAFEYCRTERKWADDLAKEGQGTKLSPESYWRQAKLYSYALMCLNFGVLDDNAYTELIQLLLLFRKSARLAAELPESTLMDQAVSEMMGRRIVGLHSFIGENTHILTESLSLLFDRMPCGLTWTNIASKCGGETVCFEAVHDDLFSVNIFDGTVLVNGVPPSVLPTSITTCKLYQRTFGKLNFVVVSGSRGFRAEKIVNGRYLYEFQTGANGSLLIREEDCKTGDKLLLLEPSNLDVPVLLREHHSHWYSTNTGCVFLRGILFSDQQITYVMSRKDMYFVPITLRATLADKAFPVPTASSFVPDSRDSGSSFSGEEATRPGPQRYQATLVHDGGRMDVFQSISAMSRYRTMCHEELRLEDQFRVFKRTKDFVKNLEPFERLVQGETCAATFLHGFEANAFVHIYHDVACNSLRFDLPRLKLSFLLRDKVMSSIEFNGFSVVDQAAIRDTLPELSACVVIRHSDGREKLILTDGRVKENAVVEIPTNPHTSIRRFVYDVHSRFRHLHTATTVGLLHLASLYASCACMLPEGRWRKPPNVIASQYVRWSWKNEPLSERERGKLEEISQHAARSCSTLSLVCTWLWHCSNSVAFLHGTEIKQRLDSDPLAVDDYTRDEYAPRLEPSEARLFLGIVPPKTTVSLLPDENESQVITYIKMKEEEILNDSTCKASKPVQQECKLPLNHLHDGCGIERRLFLDLEESYRTYCRLDTLYPVPNFQDRLRTLLVEVRAKRLAIESSILLGLQPREGKRGTGHTLSLYSGRTEQASSIDLLRLLCDDSSMSWDRLNPFLDGKCRQKHRSDCLDWGALCVLEDRLERIASADSVKDPQGLLAELTCIRRWDPKQHPRWIAFEVEQGLQIRPDQYCIIEQLLKTPGGILQLNMGLGMLNLNAVIDACFGIHVIPVDHKPDQCAPVHIWYVR